MPLPDCCQPPPTTSRRARLAGGLLLVTAFASGAAAETVRTVAELKAPAGANWTSAALVTTYSKEAGSGAHGNPFPDTFEEARVDLQVLRGPDVLDHVVLAGVFQQAAPLLQRSMAREVVTADWKLTTSPDGRWIGVSRDGGRHVQPVLAFGPLLTTSHRRPVDTQAPNGWAAWPSPRDLAIDILRGEKIPDADRAPAIAYPAQVIERDRNVTPPLELAIRWAIANPAERGIPEAVARMVMTTELALTEYHPDEALLTIGARAAASDASLRNDLLGQLRGSKTGKPLIAANAAAMLDGAPGVDLQRELAAALFVVAAPRSASDATDDPNADPLGYPVERLTWRLARTVARERRVTPEAERAAMAVLSLLSSNRFRRRPDARSPEPPWTTLTSANQGCAIYAMQVLGWSRSASARRFLLDLPVDADSKIMAWPPRFDDRIDGLPVDAWTADARPESMPDPYGPDSNRPLPLASNPNGWLLASRKAAAS